MGNGTCTGISVLQIALLLKMEKHVSYDLRYVVVVQQQTMFLYIRKVRLQQSYPHA
jgi:hypothetical protein